MATETLPPSTLEPEDGGTPAASPPEFPVPTVDVPALRALLDGQYAEIRDLVRANLAEYASILEEAETLSRDDFRERVKDVVVEMAATGQTGMGFPKEYGGGGDIGASLAAFETLAYGDLSVLVKVGVQFGLFGGAILQLGTKHHHDLYLAKLDHRRADGLLRDDRDRPRLQRAGARHRRDVRRGDPGVRRSPRPARTPGRTTSATPRRTPTSPSSSPSSRSAARRQGSEGVHAFVVPIREGGEVCAGVTIEDDGLKMGLNGVDNGRIRFDGVRVPRTALLNRFADVGRGRHLRQRHRERQPPLLHDARHPGPGPGLRRRRRPQRRQGRDDDRDPLRPPAPPVRGDHRGRGGPAPRLRAAPAPAVPAAGADLRARLRPGDRRGPVPRRVQRATRQRREGPPRARVARRRHQGAGHLARDPDHPGVPRGLRRRGLPRRSTGSPRSRRTPTSSRPSRATTRSCCSWSPRGCSPTTPASSRRWTSSAWSGSSPTSPSRR